MSEFFQNSNIEQHCTKMESNLHNTSQEQRSQHMEIRGDTNSQESLSGDDSEPYQSMDGDQYYREYDDDDNETEARLRAKYLSDMDMMKLPSGRIASSRFAEKKRRPKQPREPEASPPSASPSTSTSTVPQASSLSPSSPNTTTSPSPTRTSPTPSPPPQQHLQQTLQTYLRAEQLQSRDHRLAARDDMGLLGITLQQHKALLATEKRARMQEAIGARANEWGGARKEKVKEGSKAKSPSQRNHKLLPR